MLNFFFLLENKFDIVTHRQISIQMNVYTYYKKKDLFGLSTFGIHTDPCKDTIKKGKNYIMGLRVYDTYKDTLIASNFSQCQNNLIEHRHRNKKFNIKLIHTSSRFSLRKKKHIPSSRI